MIPEGELPALPATHISIIGHITVPEFAPACDQHRDRQRLLELGPDHGRVDERSYLSNS